MLSFSYSFFETLIVGSLVLTGIALTGLLFLLIKDIIKKNIW